MNSKVIGYFSFEPPLINFAKVKPNMILKKVSIMRGGKRSIGRRWFRKNEPLALPGKEIGKGKISKVFEVGEGVAYKSYKSGSDGKILEREVRNLKYLNQYAPGISPKYISHDENGILMERVGGQTLEKYIRSVKDLNPLPTEFFKLGEKVGEVIDKIHKVNFVHTDLTENNIILDKKGRIRLLDLEDSKIFKPTSESKYFYFDEDIEVLLGGLPINKQEKKLFIDGFFKKYKQQ